MTDHPSIAVVGASSFVGRELLRELERREIRATAIVRSLPEVTTGFHAIATSEDRGARYDVVINLAYPNSGPAHSYPRQNREIMATVEGLLGPEGRLVHVSTQAVFGSALERPVVVGAAPRARDFPYVEAKLEAEHHIARRQRSADIVRLGNVWGRASGSWAVPLVQRLLTGRPVGVIGRTGFSNTTDTANVASYLAHLAVGHGDDGIRYHHLAEFSGVRWSEWADAAARVMAVSPVYAPTAALAPKRGGLAVNARVAYRRLADGRVSGSWVRSGLRRMPDPLRERLRGTYTVQAADEALSTSELTYLSIMASETEFASSVVPDWTPPVSKDESLRGFLQWLAGDET